MGFSPLAEMNRRIPDVGRSSPRNSHITGVGIHYQYGKNAHGEATNPSREVSANYWITNEGDILPNIDENRRAWTSGATGYPAGANADHRNITVEVSCIAAGTDKISEAAFKSLLNLMVDVYKRYGLGVMVRSGARGIGVHKDWVPTSCPGDHMMGRLPGLISDGEKLRSGSQPAKPSTPKPSSVDIEALANAVIRGEYGNGEERKKKLGSNYARVQARVNQILAQGGATASKPASVNIEQLAKDTLAGKYGNGEERMRRLGNNYAAVQARVNQLLGLQPTAPVVPSKPAGANINQLARAVIRGDYGNGDARRKKLGALYPAVQAEVNRILGY